jgi:deoxyribodipyrimidine photo-lyase
VLKDDGTPYTVFTPYSKKWKSLFSIYLTEPFECSSLNSAFLRTEPFEMPRLADMGFKETDLIVPPKEVEIELIRNYDKTRDLPAINGTSRLSVHLRFGTISPREIAAMAFANNEKFLNELIWREFYMAILYHFPHAAKRAFRPKYDRIEWEHNEVHFEAWCKGETGYPMVDAGMRQLNRTGFMHNRVRMVVASFFTKHLLLDWRLGEAYFARKLLDFELSSNNGGWQWAAGSGCDAAPYFRVFNPELQQKKFDPNGEYVRYWAPEYGTNSYSKPIIEHKFARNRAIERYKAVLKSDN